MQWDASPWGGFTTGPARPWLPVGDTAACNMAVQREDPSSVLRYCRDLISLRRAEIGTQIANYAQLPAPAGSWCYTSGPLTVAANFADQPVPLPGFDGDAVRLSSLGVDHASDDVLTLAPWEGIIAGQQR